MRNDEKKKESRDHFFHLFSFYLAKTFSPLNSPNSLSDFFLKENKTNKKTNHFIGCYSHKHQPWRGRPRSKCRLDCLVRPGEREREEEEENKDE